jgi:hypothetical protein
VRVAVVGAGAVGARAARQLVSVDGIERILVASPSVTRREQVAEAIGPVAIPIDANLDTISSGGCDAAVIAAPAGSHGAIARHLLGADMHVVSVSDAVTDVEALLDLDSEARERGRAVIAGAGFAPGLSCALARHLAGLFAEVTEIHVAKVGTGGPACARARRRALVGPAVEWRDGAWIEHGAGSGRALCWFPDPIGGRDCFRAALPDPLLLAPAFPRVERVSARVAATLGERAIARVPDLRRSRPRSPAMGDLGAIRVEVRGRTSEGGRGVRVYGALDRPGVAAGAVAAVACGAATAGRLERWGAGGVAELVDPRAMLEELARRGVKAAVFEGAAP